MSCCNDNKLFFSLGLLARKPECNFKLKIEYSSSYKALLSSTIQKYSNLFECWMQIFEIRISHYSYWNSPHKHILVVFYKMRITGAAYNYVLCKILYYFSADSGETNHIVTESSSNVSLLLSHFKDLKKERSLEVLMSHILRFLSKSQWEIYNIRFAISTHWIEQKGNELGVYQKF